MLEIDTVWWIVGSATLAFVMLAYCTLILSGRIGNEMDGVGTHLPFEGSPFLPPEGTDRSEHDALADGIEQDSMECPMCRGSGKARAKDGKGVHSFCGPCGGVGRVLRQEYTWKKCPRCEGSKIQTWGGEKFGCELCDARGEVPSWFHSPSLPEKYGFEGRPGEVLLTEQNWTPYAADAKEKAREMVWTHLPPARESSAQKADMAQEIKVYRQTLEALAHFTSDPWAEHLARKVWDKPTTETAEFAIAQAPRMSPDQNKKTKLVEAKGSALAVKDDKIGQYVLTVGQQIKWFYLGGGFQRGRIESFYENENAADDSDRWYVRVLDERTGKPRTVLSNRVQPLTKDLW